MCCLLVVDMCCLLLSFCYLVSYGVCWFSCIVVYAVAFAVGCRMLSADVCCLSFGMWCWLLYVGYSVVRNVYCMLCVMCGISLCVVCCMLVYGV